ncbi:MAG: hypothetical protein V8T86_10800 [Victivallis sp.]
MTAGCGRSTGRLKSTGCCDNPNFGMNNLRARWWRSATECTAAPLAARGALGPDAVVHLVFERLEMLRRRSI